MTREDFLKTFSALGLGAVVAPSLLSSCSTSDDPIPQFDVNFSGKVLIIGAGAAGITAAYALNQYGIDFELIEAAPIYGGRVKETTTFADFPIDLGGEWIHTDPSVLATLINDNSVQDNIDIINYKPESLSVWRDGKLRKRNFFTNFYGEHKFKNSTWYSFFENYMVPDIQDRMVLNTPITAIDYSGNEIVATAADNRTFTGDRMILTVPLTILKQNRINFTPALPAAKLNALDDVQMPDGIKVFMEFSEQFYPDLLVLNSIWDFLGAEDGDLLYYNAAFGKDTNRNILGLFSVGDVSSQFAQITDDNDLINYHLDQLDHIFDGKPRQTYIRHITQNWSQEPYIGGSYSHYDDESNRADLIAPVSEKIWFAGETYAAEDYATVHGAARSAYVAVEEILAG